MICRSIDTHCRFDFSPSSSDEETNLQRAAQTGVGKTIVLATEMKGFARVRALAEKYQPLHAALGLHPGMLKKRGNISLDQLQQALERRPVKMVAVGKIDLDLFGDDPRFKRQQWLLNEQPRLAKRYDLPMILHSRHTHDKLAVHLKRHDLSHTGVVRGFSDSLQQAEWFIRLGYKIDIGGTITYPCTSKTRDVITKLLLALLLLETDAPNMSLNGFQGKLSRPEQTARVSDVLCELRPEPEDEIAEVLSNNTYAVSSVHGQFTLRRQHPAVGT